ncbi:hypothetical protein [Microtetraspora glauca]|uniref:DUF222 domain-containing protein n=1 Tax=Microtetraspora glauca TaxID=1996 RepID=A0ABV3GTX1_MICGL
MCILTFDDVTVLLITMDIGHALGAPSGASLTAGPAGLSPLPAEQARRVIQRRLHTLAVLLDEDAITRVRREPQIPADSFPRDHQPPNNHCARPTPIWAPPT